jgi:hypothetical protein
MEVIMSKKIVKKTIILCLTWWLSFGLFPGQAGQIEHDPLHYDVQVTAQVIPIFAVDKNGDPVYDLKEEEIELYINKNSYKILDFISCQVTGEVEKRGDIKEEQVKTVTGKIRETKGEKTRSKVKINSEERIKFIILDGVSNSKSGVRNAKKLAEGIVKSAAPGDSFVLLQATPQAGVNYLIGPEKDKNKLLKALDNIYKNPDWVLLVPFRAVARTAGADAASQALLDSMWPMSQSEKDDLTGKYRKELDRFSRTLREFKYALKTIRVPKTVFLVSGGVQEFSGDSQYYDQSFKALTFYYDTMKQAAVDINKGGSLLYLVNPIPETRRIKKALGVMSRISNAKCIGGRDVNDMLRQLKNNTAAYYEVAFSHTPELGENFKIKIKCKRKGVTLNTLNYGEKAKPYAEMPKLQKELYALNVVTGGSWSRMVGTVKPTVYRKLEETTGKEIIVKKINVTIPRELRGKKLDVFTLNVDPATFKADIRLDQRMTDERENLDIEVEAQKGKVQYIVIIEPEKTHCVFTRVS